MVFDNQLLWTGWALAKCRRSPKPQMVSMIVSRKTLCLLYRRENDYVSENVSGARRPYLATGRMNLTCTCYTIVIDCVCMCAKTHSRTHKWLCLWVFEIWKNQRDPCRLKDVRKMFLESFNRWSSTESSVIRLSAFIGFFSGYVIDEPGVWLNFFLHSIFTPIAYMRQ